MQTLSARQKSMMKFLIKEQYESVWFVDPVSVLSCEKKRRYVIIVCVLCCTSPAASAVGGHMIILVTVVGAS